MNRRAMAWALWLRCCALAMLLLAVTGCHHAESLPTGAQATPQPVVIDDSFTELSLGKRVELAYDPTGLLGVDDVRVGKLEFIPSNKEVPSLGLRAGAAWVRFRLARSGRHQNDPLLLELAHTVTDFIDVYTINEDGSSSVARAGDHVPHDGVAPSSTNRSVQKRKLSGVNGITEFAG
jgi:7TMR-DISM extracellular 2